MNFEAPSKVREDELSQSAKAIVHKIENSDKHLHFGHGVFRKL